VGIVALILFRLSSPDLLMRVHLVGRSVLLTSVSMARLLCFARLTTLQSHKNQTFSADDIMPSVDSVVVSLLVFVLTVVEWV